MSKSTQYKGKFSCDKSRFVEGEGWTDRSILLMGGYQTTRLFDSPEDAVRDFLSAVEGIPGAEIVYGPETNWEDERRIHYQGSMVDEEREEPAILDIDIYIEEVTTEPIEADQLDNLPTYEG